MKVFFTKDGHAVHYQPSMAWSDDVEVEHPKQFYAVDKQ